jgi:hypothetical protein
MLFSKATTRRSANKRRAPLMKNKISSIAVFLLLTLLTSAWAGDLIVLGNWILIGNWISKETGRQGIVETVFSFKVNGMELTGTVANAQGETSIREGRINGNEISFVVMLSVGGNERKLAYKGQVSLDEIRFKLELQGLKGQPLEFVAKRESQFQRVFSGKGEFRRDGDVPLRIPSEGKIRIPDK